MIRTGYIARNPVTPGFLKQVQARTASLDNPIPKFPPSTAHGFTILGMSGVGKTRGVEAILSLYPQVIVHSEYVGYEFLHMQIVWLKLDCPFDGSLKGLMLNFFQALDALLGTRYYETYAGSRRTVDELLPCLARLASLHSVGVLVVDEVQHLSESKSGGHRKMLNLFVQLVNTIGLPVVLVGTYKAMAVLSGEFRQIRRGSGQGDLVWDRMQENEVWQLFVESLWRYQYVTQRTPLTTAMSRVLYEVTQGVTDFAVKTFMLVQVRAITSGVEAITESGIRSVAEVCLRMAHPILTALRTGNTRVLSTMEDIHPIDFDLFLNAARRSLSEGGCSDRLLPQTQIDRLHPQPAPVQNPTPPTPPKQPTGKRTRKQSPSTFPEGSLPDIASRGEEQKKTAYDSLKQAGCIRDPEDYL